MREERDLFPDFNVLIGAFSVLLSIVRNELKILLAAIALEARENAHWDVVGHILKDLLPPVNLRLQREDALHALIHGLLAQSHNAPDRIKCRLVLIQVFDVVLQACDLLLLYLYGLFYMLDALDRLLQALQVVDLALDPRDDLRVRVAKLIRQTFHHMLVLVVRMG